MIINVTIQERPDGGVSVYSEDLAGLVLSGKNRVAILKAIEPAARAILEHNGQDASNIRIDATIVKEPAPHLCPGGIDPGFEECPKCGATMDDDCAG